MSNQDDDQFDIRTISAEDLARKCPELYFGSRGPSSEGIASRVVEGALILGATNVQVFKLDRWQFICANHDWLSTPTNAGTDETSIFERPWAFTEAGINWNRSEVWVRVFSEQAFTLSQQSYVVVNGDPGSESDARARTRSLGQFERIIGYIFTNAI